MACADEDVGRAVIGRHLARRDGTDDTNASREPRVARDPLVHLIPHRAGAIHQAQPGIRAHLQQLRKPSSMVNGSLFGVSRPTQRIDGSPATHLNTQHHPTASAANRCWLP